MLVAADKKQLEWRVAVELSGDTIGRDEIRLDLDFHAENQKTFGLPSRLISKIYLFRTIFRGTAYGFAKDPDFSGVSDDPEYWEEIARKFYRKYQGLDRWHKHLADLSLRSQPYTGFTGRSWLVPPYITPEGETKLQWSSFTNHPVQGTGADLVKLTRIKVHQKMIRYNMKSKLVNTIHDSNVADCPDDEVNAMVNIFHEASDELPRDVQTYFNHTLSIPFPCECKAGPSLGELVPIDRTA